MIDTKFNLDELKLMYSGLDFVEEMLNDMLEDKMAPNRDNVLYNQKHMFSAKRKLKAIFKDAGVDIDAI